MHESLHQGNTNARWQPIGDRKIRVALWGIVHNHAHGKFDALQKLSDDFEFIGWVDDSASTAMRLAEPNTEFYAAWPRLDGEALLRGEIPCDLVVVECSNSELVGVATRIAEAGLPMHMDKPLGTSQAGFRRISALCEERGIPLQIGYMFRANEAINKMVELARAGVVGDVFSIDADLDHSYGYPKYPTYATHYPGGTAYLLACHAIEWAMPIFDDAEPLRTHSIVKPAPGDPDGAVTHTLTILEYPRANVTIRVCSRGTQPCRHIRIDGTDGMMEIEPIEDFRSVKHTTGLDEAGLARVDRLEVRLFLKTVNEKAQARGFREGVNRLTFPAPDDRYAGQLRELARIVRGEIPFPQGLYRHDLLVHKVSLEACNLPTEPV